MFKCLNVYLLLTSLFAIRTSLFFSGLKSLNNFNTSFSALKGGVNRHSVLGRRSFSEGDPLPPLNPLMLRPASLNLVLQLSYTVNFQITPENIFTYFHPGSCSRSRTSSASPTWDAAWTLLFFEAILLTGASLSNFCMRLLFSISFNSSCTGFWLFFA